MKQLSAKATGLLCNLGAPSRWIGLLSRGGDQRLAAITELGELGEVEVAPHLIPLLVDASASEASMKAIARILDLATDEDLLDLDEGVREHLQWHLPPGRALTTTDLQNMRIGESEAHAVFGLLSMHPSGYVRLAAVERLMLLRDGQNVPYLLIRLNDWVESVRDASREALLQRLRAGSFRDFFHHLHLVLRLLDCGRDDHSPLVIAIIEGLGAPEADDALIGALTSPSRLVRRRTYSTLMARSGHHRERVVKYSICSDDPVLRLWATRNAALVLSEDELRRDLPQLLHDPFMAVRREGLRCVMSRWPSDARAALTEALLDTSQSLREFSRFHLRRFGHTDFADHYRKALEMGASTLAAIGGLGETGDASDLPAIEPYLKHQRPRIRSAAVRAVGQLAPERIVRQLILAVQDASKRVTNEAGKTLSRVLPLVEMGTLADILNSSQPRHVRLAVLDLVDGKGTWEAMPHLLAAAASHDEQLAFMARAKVRSKFNGVFTKPSPSQQHEIQIAINRFTEVLMARDPIFLEETELWLKTRT